MRRLNRVNRVLSEMARARVKPRPVVGKVMQALPPDQLVTLVFAFVENAYNAGRIDEQLKIKPDQGFKAFLIDALRRG